MEYEWTQYKHKQALNGLVRIGFAPLASAYENSMPHIMAALSTWVPEWEELWG